MTELARNLQDVPWQQMFPILMVLLVGLVLWAYGHKVLRGGFAAMGLIIGATLGYVLGGSVDLGVSPWVTAGIGGVAAGVIGLVAYKLAMVVAMAGVFAVGAMVGVLAVAEFQGMPTRVSATQPDSQQSEVTGDLGTLINAGEKSAAQVKTGLADAKALLDESGGGTVSSAKKKLDEMGEKAGDALGLDKNAARESVAHMKELGKSLSAAAKSRWEDLPQNLRTRVMWGGIIGAIAGLLVGGVFVKPAVMILTAAGGSLLWLSSAGVVAGRMGAGDNSWVPGSGQSWMAVWLITALVGVGIQWTFRSKSADTPA